VATSRIVTDPSSTVEADRVEVRLEAGAFPRDAVYAAAYAFTDRCYVRLDRPDATTLGVTLRAKVPGSLDGPALAVELREQLAAEAFRQRIAEDGHDFMTAIAVGPPGETALAGIDDLLAAPDDFDDPLGIATSWEQKHASKPEAP
jgi:His-Xaa-Ser system protein HxsD